MRSKEADQQSERDENFVHPDAMMDAALDWFFRLREEPDNVELKSAFQTWLAADSLHAQKFRDVSDSWDIPDLDVVASEFIARDGFPSAVQEAKILRGSWNRRTILRSLTAVAAVLILAVVLQQYPSVILRWQADHLTAAGDRQDVTLPDGSHMILNTDSAVALDFEGAKRSVKLLRGEAYFQVVSDKTRPFTVDAAYSEVTVTGTEFSVHTESEEDVVVLKKGNVDVALLSKRREQASLTEGESITVTRDLLSTVRKTDTANSLAWLDGRLVFSDQPLSQVIREVARYYGRRIVIANSRLENVRVNGSYEIDNPENIVRSLALAAGASAVRLPGGIIFLR